MEFKVRPFNSAGGWSTPYRDYYLYSKESYSEYLRIANVIKSEERRLAEKHRSDGVSEEYIDSYVIDDLADLHNKAYRAAIECHLYACMALEGFLNLYGVRRLGESFYQKNLERVGIIQKLSLIGVCCGQWYVDEDAQVSKDFRDLFDSRNRLVHPKTREITSMNIERFVYVHPAEIPVAGYIEQLERCVDFFMVADGSLSRDFMFPQVLRS